MLPRLSLVIGGVASGKSAFAEALALRAGAPVLYVATAEAGDDEMRAKIAAHRARRGPNWTTVEAPHDLVAALGAPGEAHAVLVDCATMWLSNQMTGGSDPEAGQAGFIAALAASRVPVVVVTNEVGLGGIAGNVMARRFAAAQGRLNQALASEAGLVVLVAAGLPLVLKGVLPDG